MNDFIASLLLGLVEGITEFLPISSTGHLLIAEHWLGARSDLFNIAIQAGAILAVVLIYRQRLLQLAFGFADRGNRDHALKLGLAFGVTAVLGLTVKKLGVQLPETLAPVAWALLIGGVLMLWAERAAAKRASALDEGNAATHDGAPFVAGISWGAAALVGVAQVAAGVFPGTSRSAAAIFAALLFGGVGRAAATEFAFLFGIPTMFAATAYELLHVLRDGGAANEDWTGLGVAFVVSALTAFAAVKWMLGYIVTHRFTVFSWYRIVLGAALLVAIWLAPAQVSGGKPAPGQAGLVASPSGALNTGDPAGRGAGKGRQSDAVFAHAAATQGASYASSRAAAAANATREYEALLLCVNALAIKPQLDSPQQRAELDDYSRGKGHISGDPAWDLMVADKLAHSIDVVERAKTECEGIGERAVDGSIYALARRAAELGNGDAALCYLMSPWPMSQARWDGGQERAEYARSAQALIDAGLRAGDWRMVSLAITAAYVPTGRAELQAAASARAQAATQASPWQSPGLAWLLALTPGGDAERHVALLRLQQAAVPNVSTAALLDRLATEATRAHLSTQQARRAAAWAESTYRQSFQGKQRPGRAAPMSVCD
ncbi:hypothetical protein BH11PSE14_BH11PSE14_22650 [soil metagenome]